MLDRERQLSPACVATSRSLDARLREHQRDPRPAPYAPFQR
jgi:hypothetical protein